MSRFRTKVKHLLILLALGYGYSVWLLHKSTKKPMRHVSSKFRVQPRDADPSLKTFIRKLPLKERFEIERRHIGYNLKLDQKDDFDFATCGTWPAAYLKNKQIRNPRTASHQARAASSSTRNVNHSKQRILIHSCGGEQGGGRGDESCGSLSDRLLSAASLFVYSLLSDREFFLDWQGTRTQLRSVLRTPFLNLNPQPQDPRSGLDGDIQASDSLSVSLQDWEAADLDIAFRIQSTSIFLETRSRLQETEQHQHALEIRDRLTMASQLKVELNRGLVQRFLTDSAYSDRLEQIGLRQHNAYACVLSFLFRPTLILQELLHQYRAVFKTPGVVTIGIHIPSRIEPTIQGRSHQRLTLEDFDQSIPCAQNLSHAILQSNKTYLSHSRRFLYVILTDSETIRQQVQEQYGHQVDLIFPPLLRLPLEQHLSLQRDVEDTNARFKRRGVRTWDQSGSSRPEGKGEKKEEEEDEESTILHSYLFSETDYQIITASGFSKLALFGKGTAGRRTAILMPLKEDLDPEKGTSRPDLIKFPDCSRLDDAIAPWDLIASLGSLG